MKIPQFEFTAYKIRHCRCIHSYFTAMRKRETAEPPDIKQTIRSVGETKKICQYECWSSDGDLIRKYFTCEDKKHGEHVSYYTRKELKEAGVDYTIGERAIKELEIYDMGERIGIWKKFDMTGKVINEVNYDDCDDCDDSETK